MSGSGKSLLGLWLYRTGEEWALKDGEHEVSLIKITNLSRLPQLQRSLFAHFRNI